MLFLFRKCNHYPNKQYTYPKSLKDHGTYNKYKEFDFNYYSLLILLFKNYKIAEKLETVLLAYVGNFFINKRFELEQDGPALQ